MDYLTFIFASFWHWAGTAALLFIVTGAPLWVCMSFNLEDTIAAGVTKSMRNAKG